MKYYAKLTLGGYYSILSKAFERGVETPVTKEEYDYLSKVVEKKLETYGGGFKIVDIPRFALRVEEPTQEEKVLEEVKQVPEKLAFKKPAAKN